MTECFQFLLPYFLYYDGLLVGVMNYNRPLNPQDAFCPGMLSLQQK